MAVTLAKEALIELLGLECSVDEYGTVRYYSAPGQLHREYGPAVEHPGGYRAWYQNGLRHRIDGPAVEYSAGGREWHQNGRLHRLDGPAIEGPDGYRVWYINDNELTEAEWQQQVASMETA